MQLRKGFLENNLIYRMIKKLAPLDFTVIDLNKKTSGFIVFMFVLFSSVHAQFVHPGITHKKSDLDRMKYMVKAKIDPWYSSYQEMVADSKSSYNYVVQGDLSFTELGRDNKVNYNAWNSDIRAAYYNALRWYIDEESEHADKAIDIFNSWVNLQAVTSNGTTALSGGVGYIMIEAAEIIKHTYSGWSAVAIKKFEDMLVYPGYSNRAVPSGISKSYGTFYWQSYQGDPIRHGNQGLSGWRTVMAMGIFLDNDIMYDRALRYIKGLPHRSDDLPYPAGPNTSKSITGSNDYSDTYSVTRGYSQNDYGYNELMTNYIYDNGQCQESSRDQQHTTFGIGLLTSMAEMAWNQGEDLYGFTNNRLLLGLEYNMRYNVSDMQSYPDQTTPWNPTVNSGEFKTGFDRTGRWYSKAVSPEGRGDFSGVRPVFEMPVAHYLGRGLKIEDHVKWTLRARDKSIELAGYEKAGWTNDAIGWGALTARRPVGCYGDPISGFDSNRLPVYNMNTLSNTIEAEHFDYSVVSGQDRVYNDLSIGNTGGVYRTDAHVDLLVCSEGGYHVSSIQSGEWLTYTVNVPVNGTYDLSVRYAAAKEGGTIKFSFDGQEVTSDLAVPYGDSYSSGLTDWKDFKIADGVSLSQGVQILKLLFGGVDEAFELNNFTVSVVEQDPDPINLAVAHGIATQSSTAYNGPPELAIDGNTNGNFGGGSVTHTSHDDDPKWWQVDLQGDYPIETIILFNRTGSNYGERLNDFTVEVRDSNGVVTLTQFYAAYPNPSLSISTDGVVGSVVRISKTSDLGLSLAEVEVFGVDNLLSNERFETKNKFKIYPNPVLNKMTVSLVNTNLDKSHIQVALYALNGKKVMDLIATDEKEVSMNLSELDSGVYLLIIGDNRTSFTKKIVKI